MIVTIHQPQFLPWLGYFDKIHRADIFIVLDNVQFKKNEWQNRNRIKTHQGWQWLTVPVIHDFGQMISDVKINNRVDWKRKHLNALELNYRKTPFFDRYFQELKLIYDQEWKNLSDFNIALIHQFISWLKLEKKIVMSSDFDIREDGTTKLVELCKALGAKRYLSGAGGNNYLNFDLFKESGIEVVIQNYEHPVYFQYKPNNKENEFVSNLSAIDLLLNCGPDSLSVLSGVKVN